ITRGINVSLEDNELTIDFHVIVSYGVSILAVYNNLTDSVKYHVEEFTGIRVKKINMYVEGVRVID
ncbi:MAG: Asp23/Gls24 family envelope stress response protein, partial [Lachnospiraceae bacterium]|nr:Asp23/Gls24 family envelope stress response protein [Lachnospiraceae bacterium]